MSKSHCPTCSEAFESLGQHFRHSDHRPALTDWQFEVCVGLVLGDGCVAAVSGGRENSLTLEMSSEGFLRWLDEEMGWLTTGVRLHRTAKENAQHSHSTGLEGATQDVSNYDQTHVLEFRAHPAFSRMRERFYPDGGIALPDDLVLTPTRGKYWYLSDGGLQFHTEAEPTLQLSTRTFDLDKVAALFENKGFNPGCHGDHAIQFPNTEAKDVLNWFGSPPPGFESKWL